MPVTVKVLFFAKSREVVGVAEQEVALEDSACTTLDLIAALHRQHPQLKGVMSSCVLALNQEYIKQQEVVTLKSGDEVAVIPPLSGG